MRPKKHFIPLVMTLGLLALTGMAADCGGDPVGAIIGEDSDPEPREVTINTFDQNGTPIADFTFRQAGSNVSLRIHSLVNAPVNLTYQIDFVLNATAWSSQGSVQSLQPGQTVEKGKVANNPARIDLGGIRIVLTSIQPG